VEVRGVTVDDDQEIDSDAQSHLRDILAALDDIQQFVAGIDGEAFQADAKTGADRITREQ
jgi:uncharacterized protein with HEPN domain